MKEEKAKRRTEGLPCSPRFARWLLHRIHKDQGYYSHVGDFEEIYRDKATAVSRSRASVWYWRQVFRSIPGYLSNNFYWRLAMLKNYIIISLRNIFKNKWFSLINIAGLGVGMACFLLITAYVRHEFSYDHFFSNNDRVYRLLVAGVNDEGKVDSYSIHVPHLLAPLLMDEFPEIANTTRLFSSTRKNSILQKDDRIHFADGTFADARFLQTLRYPLIAGSAENALKQPNSIVITRSMAQNMFGTSDPFDQTITYREGNNIYNVKITGVIEDPPENSHLHFDFLLSIATQEADKRWKFQFNTWNVGNFITYIELKPGVTASSLEAKLPAFYQKHRGLDEESLKKMRVKLQPLTDIHLRSNLQNERATNNEIRYVYLFGTIALIILLIAAVNYMNLTTARSTTRAREIGIRKVTGANRRQLFRQFIGESVFTAILAALLAVGLIHLFLVPFRKILAVELRPGDLLNPAQLLIIFATALAIGILAGIYPAFVLSSFQPVRVLRKDINSGSRSTWIRSFLVVLQFTASIVLLIGTMIIFRQMKYIQQQDLGYDREHVVVLPLRETESRNNAPLLKKELLQHPEIQAVSISSGMPLNIRSHLRGLKVTNDEGETVPLQFRFDYVDDDFLSVYGINLVRGRNFSRERDKTGQTILINQSLAEETGWKEPLGKSFDLFSGDSVIVGVTEDFHFETFHNDIGPMILIYEPGNNLAVRMHPGNIINTMSLIEGIFKKNINSQPFDYFFLSDAYNDLYRKERRTGEIFGTFSLLAVFIACLGLFGLASFSVERRTKEIGIRKVLGASESRLVRLLTKNFIRLIIAANLVAWPAAYLFMHSWIRSFSYRITISIWEFLLAAAGALLIAFLTIGSQTIRAALRNPADTLRCE